MDHYGGRFSDSYCCSGCCRRQFFKKINSPSWILPILIKERYSVLYIALFLIASLILMFTGYSVVESMFSVASAQGNVGLSIVSNFNIVSKLVLMFVMIAGRLEIWSVLVLIGYIFAKRG